MQSPAMSLYDPPEVVADIADLNPLDRDHLPIIERHLLGCCMWDGYGFDEAATLIEAKDFAIADHAAIWAAMDGLRRVGRDVWPADVFESLFEAGRSKLACFKGNAALWLHETADLEPSGTRARYYARHVREASLFRQLRGAAVEILRDATSPTGPAAEVLGNAERLLFELTDASNPAAERLRSAPEMMRDAVARIDERIANGGGLSGLATGYADIDDLLGGMRPGQLIIVGARPGGGKTALGLNLAANLTKSGVPVLAFSMEMPESEIAGRLVAMGSGVSMHKISRGERLSDRESAAVVGAANAFGGTPFYLDDTPDQPAARLASICRRAVRRAGVQLAVVDYLQLMRPENPRENRTQQVGMIARRMKQMARECEIPVVCMCQLNRQVEGRGDGKPRLSDLRESGEIEQHADAVVLLATDPQANQDDDVWRTDVIVAKNRNGPIGELSLAYRRPVMRFENMARGPEGMR